MEIKLETTCDQQTFLTAPTCTELMALPMVGIYKGSWGVLSWDIDVNIAELRFKVTLALWGITIVNVELSPQNPKIDVGFKDFLEGELGLDVNSKEIYFAGTLFGYKIRLVLFRY
ncbi:MAG: hypothetical protein ACRDDE_10825 [Paraclostridium sp.]|uniref:hypothetical protein n=1 Tax=Paraclostridium sp. TaxID=2023273 RepID=UPI003EE7B22D